LRDGVVVGRFSNERVEPRDLVELVAGQAVMDVAREMEPPAATAGPDSLEAENLCSGPLMAVSFSARRGEVLGIAGITGSGRELVLPALFGAVLPVHGTVRVNGQPVRPGRPDRAIAAGMGFLPPDRKISGGMMDMSARKNLTLANLHPFWVKWRLSRRRELQETARWFNVLDVRPVGEYEQSLVRFSGGNQQKILFSKWMRLQLSVLLLDEPSQGVDVAAKAQIHRQILAAAKTGMTIVISSTDDDELVTICSRVLVMVDGSIAAELCGDRLTVPEIVRATSKAKSHSDAGEGS
jgi:ribose transport system ATP-binding protein